MSGPYSCPDCGKYASDSNVRWSSNHGEFLCQGCYQKYADRRSVEVLATTSPVIATEVLGENPGTAAHAPIQAVKIADCNYRRWLIGQLAKGPAASPCPSEKMTPEDVAQRIVRTADAIIKEIE